MLGWAAGRFVYDMVKSDKLEQQALDKTIRSLDKLSKAQTEKNETKEHMDAVVLKFANRKRGILVSSMQDFLDLYNRIIKINFSQKDEIELFRNFSVIEQNEMKLNVKIVQNDIKTPGLTKNVVVGYLAGGVIGAISSSIVDDSKRKLDIANLEAKRARAMAIQNNSVALAYDAISQRVSRMTDILTKLNVLFVKSIQNTEKIIDKNGEDKRNYSEEDRKQLATCIDLAAAIKNFMDVPIVDEEGKVTKKSEEVLMIGNNCIDQMNDRLSQI